MDTAAADSAAADSASVESTLSTFPLDSRRCTLMLPAPSITTPPPPAHSANTLLPAAVHVTVHALLVPTVHGVLAPTFRISS